MSIYFEVDNDLYYSMEQFDDTPKVVESNIQEFAELYGAYLRPTSKLEPDTSRLNSSYARLTNNLSNSGQSLRGRNLKTIRLNPNGEIFKNLSPEEQRNLLDGLYILLSSNINKKELKKIITQENFEALIAAGKNAKTLAQDILNIKKNISFYKVRVYIATYFAAFIAALGAFRISFFTATKILPLGLGALSFVFNTTMQLLFAFAVNAIWLMKLPFVSIGKLLSRSRGLFAVARNAFPKEKLLTIALDAKAQSIALWSAFPKELMLRDVFSKISIFISNIINRYPIALSAIDYCSKAGAKALSFVSRWPIGKTIIASCSKGLSYGVALLASIKVVHIAAVVAGLILAVVLWKLAKFSFNLIKNMVINLKAGLLLASYNLRITWQYSLYPSLHRGMKELTLYCGDLLESVVIGLKNILSALTNSIASMVTLVVAKGHSIYTDIEAGFMAIENLLLMAAIGLRQPGEKGVLLHPAYEKEGSLAAKSAVSGFFSIYAMERAQASPEQTAVFNQGYVKGLANEPDKESATAMSMPVSLISTSTEGSNIPVSTSADPQRTILSSFFSSSRA